MDGLREVAGLKDPVGTADETIVRPNGLEVSRVRIPLGVIGIIYESRPNVTAETDSLTKDPGWSRNCNLSMKRPRNGLAAGSRSALESVRTASLQYSGSTSQYGLRSALGPWRLPAVTRIGHRVLSNGTHLDCLGP